ncbi:MAG: hypothetical protein K8U57_08520 [Planctomycetes bacterium]|nr:hypothetical protein [Planctomycetota bacterium]
MALVVVRCVGCRGASRVATSILGVDVECPRCGVAFRAMEEATLIVPGPGWVAPNPPPARTWRGPVAPPALNSEDDDDFEDENEEEAFKTVAEDEQPHKSEHDPHGELSPLPASVFIGFSLLPFLIPIVWLVASAVIGQAPMLTFAAPLALAISTSILCLAVISTVDWTPATQIKGVLVLVVLSYFTGLGLYVLKKEMVDRVKKFLGTDQPLILDAPKDAGYQVSVPARAVDHKGSPLTIAPLTCRQVTFQRGLQGPYTFVYGSSPKPGIKPQVQNPAVGTDKWFDKVIDEIKQSGGILSGPEPLRYQKTDKIAGREVVQKQQDGQVRVLRVYVIEERVYYLSVERLSLDLEDDVMQAFFESFQAL